MNRPAKLELNIVCVVEMRQLRTLLSLFEKDPFSEPPRKNLLELVAGVSPR